MKQDGSTRPLYGANAHGQHVKEVCKVYVYYVSDLVNIGTMV